MAKPIITRLQVEAQQHNQGLAKAQQSLQKYAQGAFSADSVVKGLIGTFGKYAGAVGIATTAMNVMKNAMMSIEATADTYETTMRSCESVSTSFYTSLANFDFSNFLNGLDDIVSKAKAAYNALDEFESFTARFNPKQQVLEGEIQTKLQQARAAKAQGDETKAKQLLDEANAKIKELTSLTRKSGQMQTYAAYKEIRSQVSSNSNGRIDLTDKQIDYYVDPKNWDEINKKAEKYKQLIADSTADMIGGVKSAAATESAKLKAAKARAALAKDPSLERAYTYLNVRDSGDSEAAARWKQAHQNIYGNKLADQRIESLQARVDRMDGVLADKPSKTGKTKESPLTGTTLAMSDLSLDMGKHSLGSIAFEQDYLKEWQTKYAEAGDAAGRDYAQSMIDAIKEGIEQLKTDGFIEIDMSGPINTAVDEAQNKIQSLAAEGKKTKDTVGGVATAFTAVGNALNQIDDPGAKVAGYIATAIGQTAAAFGTAQTQAATMGPWAWIAFAATGLATMISTITSIKSATAGAYAEGGVIGGNSYAGDRLYARVNSGETILNQDQAQRALDAMDSTPVMGGGGNSSISGEQIVTVINAYGRRTGRGEILR